MELVKDSVSFRKRLNPDYTPKNLFIYNNFRDENKITEFVSETRFFEKLVQIAKEDKKIFVGCDTRESTKMLFEYL